VFTNSGRYNSDEFACIGSYAALFTCHKFCTIKIPDALIQTSLLVLVVTLLSTCHKSCTNGNSGCYNIDKFARIGSYAAVHMPQVLHKWEFRMQ